MTNRRLAAAALGLAVASAAGGLVLAQNKPAAMTSPPATPTKVGVVSVKQVIRKSQELMGLQTSLSESQNRLAAAHNGHAAQLKDMLEQIREKKLQSDAFDDAVHNLQKTQLDFEMQEKLRQVEIARDQSRGLKTLFTELQAAVAAVAAQKGLDLVIVDIDPDLPGPGQEGTFEQLQTLYGQKNVLFKAPGVTIDDDVVNTLDGMFRTHISGNTGGGQPQPIQPVQPATPGR